MRLALLPLLLFGCGPAPVRDRTSRDGEPTPATSVVASDVAALAPTASSEAPVAGASATAIPTVTTTSEAPRRTASGPVSHELAPAKGPIMWIADSPACARLKSTRPTGKVVIHEDDTTDDGPLPLAVVERVIHTHEAAVMQCYVDSPDRDGCVDAQVRIRIAVARDGSAHGTAPTDDSTLGRCVAGVVSELAFPSPEGASVRVELPIRFLR